MLQPSLSIPSPDKYCANTALGSLVTSDPVNLEIDTVARYVERMLQFESLPSAQKDHP